MSVDCLEELPLLVTVFSAVQYIVATYPLRTA